MVIPARLLGLHQVLCAGFFPPSPSIFTVNPMAKGWSAPVDKNALTVLKPGDPRRVRLTHQKMARETRPTSCGVA
jgi:hypothetical protein